MKGVILAGGTGSRLYPLTKITNKHLLPVYDKPMIHYPIEMFVKAGIEDIMVVTGGDHICNFFELLGDGSEFNANFDYTLQSRPDGIAGALSRAEGYANGEKVVVCLGDNIFSGNINEYIDTFDYDEENAYIFVTEVDNPQEYGILEIDTDLKILNIEEKPEDPKSNLAVTGLYMYPNDVFDKIKRLSPSARDELEITDINNMYIAEDRMKYIVFAGWWCDAGESIDGLAEASEKIRAEANE